MSGKKLKGIVVPLSTPLKYDESFDRKGMDKLLEYVINKGVDGVFTLGSCGEGPYFDTNECKIIMKYVVEKVGGRVPVYVGVGRNSTKETCKLAAYASKIGADFVVVMPPYFRNVYPDQLLEHYKTVAEVAENIILYNLPKKATELTVSNIKELSEIENIVGLKDSSGDLEYFKQVAKILPSFQGNDDLLYKSMIRGGIGGVVGLANIIPKKFVDLFKYIKQDRKEKASKLQKDIYRFVDIIYDKPRNAQAGVKQGLKFLGICDNTMRAPLPKVNAEEEEIINTFLESNL